MNNFGSGTMVSDKLALYSILNIVRKIANTPSSKKKGSAGGCLPHKVKVTPSKNSRGF